LDYEMLHFKYDAQYLQGVYQKVKIKINARRRKAQPKCFWNYVFVRDICIGYDMQGWRKDVERRLDYILNPLK
jgi:hypothetical protein